MAINNNIHGTEEEELGSGNTKHNNDSGPDASIKENPTDKQIEDGRVEDLTVIHQQLIEKEDTINTLEKKVNEYESIIKRKQAEFENYKKRTIRERNDFQVLANQKIIEELLPIIDNIEKAIHSSIDQEDISTIRDGIVLIEKQFKKLLETYNVKVIESVGMEFDPNLHEALQIDESKEGFNVDTVISEWQKGYFLGGKVIRHAKVVVAKGLYIDSDNTTEISIPKLISIKEFEPTIIKYIDSSDDRSFIEGLYDKMNGEYLLKKDIDEGNRKRALELFKKIDKLKKE